MLALVAIALAAVLRNGGDGAEKEAGLVERAVRETFAAYNAADVDRFLARWTDRGFPDVFGVTKGQAAEVPPALSGLRPLPKSTVAVTAVSPATVAGEGARTRVVLTELNVVRTFDLLLIRENGEWLIDEAVERPSRVPAGAAVVSVELREYGIRLSADSVTRSVVFRAVNTGRASHQLLLLRLDAALGTEESIGRVELIPPARSWPLVLRALPRGRYALVCNLLDENGVPHASRGMRVELRVR